MPGSFGGFGTWYVSQMVEISVVGDVVASLGECPVWVGSEQALYWEDIDGKAIHRYDPASNSTNTRSLPGRPGSFATTNVAGQFAVAIETDLVFLDWDSGTTERIHSVEDPARGNRLNDGRCDHAGRFIVGTMWPEAGANKFNGSLYSIGTAGSVDTLEGDVGIPNGLVFDPERSRMYWADTFHATIWVWDYDLDTGARSNKRVFFSYRDNPDVHGLPDGACLDAEGYYWSASVHGWAVTRIAPDGTVDRVVDVPLAMPTMPAFGGPNLETLYVTSIDGGKVDEHRMQGVAPGSLISLDVGVAGVPEPPFTP